MKIRLYGTSYLNMYQNKVYIKHLHKAFKKYGVNNPISRLSNYKYFSILEKVERQIARDFGSEDACIFSSGYIASVCLKNYFVKKAKKNIFYNSSYHPAWFDNSMKNINYLNTENKDFIISNSLNSFFGIKENYLEMIDKFEKIAIDVSHTAYIWNHKNEANNKILFFGSLNKAPAFPAGFIAGSKEDIKDIKKFAEYTTSTPPSIAFAKVFLQMVDIRIRQLEKLKYNMRIVDQAWNINRNDPFPIYNIGLENKSLYEKFKYKGFEISYMPYPYIYSKKYLRIILNSGLTFKNLEELVQLIISHKLIYCNN